VQARRSSSLEHGLRWCRRNPAVAGLTAAVALSLLVGTIISLVFAWTARENAAEAERQRQQAITKTAVLYHSLVGEARVIRLTRESGYRTRAWERLSQARWLDTPELNLDELRGEAVACMGDFVGLDAQIWDVPHLGKSGGPRLALHPDGVQLALGLEDCTVLVRNLATGAELPLHQHQADVSAVAFTPDGTKLVSGDVHGVVQVSQRSPAGEWTVPPRVLRAVPPLEHPFAGTELALAISPDGKHIAACPARSTSAVLWDLEDGRNVRVQSPNGELLRGLAWSPGPELILALGANLGSTGKRAILRWDVAGGHWIDRPWLLDLGHILAVAYSPDGKLVAVGCYEGFGVYDTSDFRPHLPRKTPRPGWS
jgi:WD40 repeat protein